MGTPYRGGVFSLTIGVDETAIRNHTVYAIQCSFAPMPEFPDQKEDWVVTTRYSELLDLDRQLRSRFSLAPFPGKKIFWSTDPHFVASRENDLIVYMSDLASRDDALHAPELDDLLQLSSNCIPARKRTLSASLEESGVARGGDGKEAEEEPEDESDDMNPDGRGNYCQGELLVNVSAHRPVRDENGDVEYMEYLVNCSWTSLPVEGEEEEESKAGDKRAAWTVTHRFREFDAMNDALEERFAELTLPRLPNKRILWNLHEEFAVRRRRALDRYLHTLCTRGQVLQARELDLFLELSEHVLPLRRQMVEEQRQRTAAVNYAKEYAILDLAAGASLREIRQAYHAKVEYWNVDNHHDHKLAEQKIHIIRNAYHTLVGEDAEFE